MPHKAKITALLKTKFPGVQLSKERIEQIVSKVNTKITNEDEIDGKLDELNEFFPFADLAKQDDRIRSLEVEVKKKGEQQPTPAADPEPKPGPANPTPADDTPEWAKALLQEVANLKADKVVTSRKTSLLDKFKDAPESFRNDLIADLEEIQFKDDDHFNSYLSRKEKALGDYVQIQSDAGLGKDAPVRGIGGGGKLKDDEVSPAVKTILDARAKEAAPAVPATA